MHAYCGNEPYAFASFAEDDRELISPILSELTDRGFRIKYREEQDFESIAAQITGASCVISFITDAYVSSSACRRELTFTQTKERPMLDIYVKDVALTDGMIMQLGLNQAIYKQRFASDETFYDELCTAEILADCLPKDERELLLSKKKTTYVPVREKRKKPIPTLISRAPGLLILLCAAAGPLAVHYSTLHYPGFWLLLLYTAAPLVAIAVICERIAAFGMAHYSYTEKTDPAIKLFDSGTMALFLSLIISCFFVHTTDSVILKILTSLGLHLLPTIIIFITVVSSAINHSSEENAERNGGDDPNR